MYAIDRLLRLSFRQDRLEAEVLASHVVMNERPTAFFLGGILTVPGYTFKSVSGRK